MDLLYWFAYLVLFSCFTYVILILVFDSDIGMVFAERFGNSNDVLKGKIVWITGASSGIGEHLALSCAKVGAKLVLSSRRLLELERVKQTCLNIANGKLSNADILILPMDVTDTKSHQFKLDEVLLYFGGLDILVNNAGRSQRAIWEDIDIEVDKAMFDLNVFSLVNLTRICIRYFLKIGRGHVAVTSSCAGVLGLPHSGTYTATKHAIHGYFSSLRNEKLSKNIDVTLFCPGPTFTNFLQESFTNQVGEKYGKPTQPNDNRMTGERCGHLYAVALANRINEGWVAIQPALPVYYLNCYFPNLFNRIVTWMGPEVFLKMRDSRFSMKLK